MIGSDLGIKASFKDGLFPWLETPNKDFTMHLGVWIAMGQCLVGPVPGPDWPLRRPTQAPDREWLPGLP